MYPLVRNIQEDLFASEKGMKENEEAKKRKKSVAFFFREIKQNF